MAERVIYELRVVKNHEGIWLEFSYPEDGKRIRFSGHHLGKEPTCIPWNVMRDRSRRRMRESLDFLEGLYNELYAGELN